MNVSAKLTSSEALGELSFPIPRGCLPSLTCCSILKSHYSTFVPVGVSFFDSPTFFFNTWFTLTLPFIVVMVRCHILDCGAYQVSHSFGRPS